MCLQYDSTPTNDFLSKPVISLATTCDLFCPLTHTRNIVNFDRSLHEFPTHNKSATFGSNMKNGDRRGTLACWCPGGAHHNACYHEPRMGGGMSPLVV